MAWKAAPRRPPDNGLARPVDNKRGRAVAVIVGAASVGVFHGLGTISHAGVTGGVALE
jgi:hypothetical protein